MRLPEKKKRETLKGRLCEPCGKKATRRWKGVPACQTCYQRAWEGGPFETLGGFAELKREERRERVKAHARAGKTVTQIMRALKGVGRRTVENDLKVMKRR